MKIIKDFDLLSPKWLEIAFEKKNKQYGAYELRNDSSNRHLKALIIVFVVGLFTVFLPKVVSQIEWGGKPDVTYQDSIKVTEFNEEKKAEEPIQQEYVEPPPILIKTIALTQIRVEDDDKVDPTHLQTQVEIVESNIAIGVSTNLTGEEGIRETDVKPIVNVATTQEIIHEWVEVKARYPGGDRELYKWLNDNLEYPYAAQEAGIQGKVYVNFVVRSDGRIDNVRISRGVHPLIDKAAMDVVKKMKNWYPGEKEGKKVSSYFTLPVTFILKQ